MRVNETFRYLLKNSKMGKKLTTEEFINRANNKHGGKYEYSLVDYKLSTNKVQIICSKHGKFEQEANSHLMGSGCPKCGIINNTRDKMSNNDNFIKKSKKLHGGKYDYSKVNYKNSKFKVDIICDKHGVFKMRPNCHLNNRGCPRCSGRGKTTSDFIIQANDVHVDKYDYTLIEYKGTHDKVRIICPEHGQFKQTPNNYLMGSGCPKCRESKGEKEITKWLEENNINYISQKRFSDCRDKNPLPFDFYLPELNMCIEFNGLQHYKSIPYFGGENVFKKQQKRDLIKENYCKNKNINLICIRHGDNVVDKLMEII